MSVFQDKSSAQAVLPAHQLPRIYQELPFAHPARLVLLANVSSWIPVFVSTHTQNSRQRQYSPSSEPNLIPTTRSDVLPHSPIL